MRIHLILLLKKRREYTLGVNEKNNYKNMEILKKFDDFDQSNQNEIEVLVNLYKICKKDEIFNKLVKNMYNDSVISKDSIDIFYESIEKTSPIEEDDMDIFGEDRFVADEIEDDDDDDIDLGCGGGYSSGCGGGYSGDDGYGSGCGGEYINIGGC